MDIIPPQSEAAKRIAARNPTPFNPLGFLTPSPPSEFTRNLIGLSNFLNPQLSQPAIPYHQRLALDTESEEEIASTIYVDETMDVIDDTSSEEAMETDDVASSIDPCDIDYDNDETSASPMSTSDSDTDGVFGAIDIIGDSMEQDEAGMDNFAAGNQKSQSAADHQIRVHATNQPLLPDVAHLVRCLAEDKGTIIITKCTTADSYKKILFEHPEVIYSGMLYVLGSSMPAVDFRISDNELPYPANNNTGISFSPFYEAVKFWHSHPRHKWNVKYSKKMALKPLWINHPKLSTLLCHAQTACIAHGRQ